MEIYKTEAAIPLIIFCVLAILKILKRTDLLRAKFFRNNSIMHRTWIYILIGMTFPAINALVIFVELLGSAVGQNRDDRIITALTCTGVWHNLLNLSKCSL